MVSNDLKYTYLLHPHPKIAKTELSSAYPGHLQQMPRTGPGYHQDMSTTCGVLVPLNGDTWHQYLDTKDMTGHKAFGAF